jgi:hypothetical protein
VRVPSILFRCAAVFSLIALSTAPVQSGESWRELATGTIDAEASNGSVELKRQVRPMINLKVEPKGGPFWLDSISVVMSNGANITYPVQAEVSADQPPPTIRMSATPQRIKEVKLNTANVSGPFDFSILGSFLSRPER